MLFFRFNFISLYLFLSFSWLFSQQSVIDTEILNNSSKFRTILETAQKSYKDSVDIKKISEAAFTAMLKELDPFSEYFSEKVYQGFKNSYSATMKTIGLTLISVNDTLYVLNVSVPSPADTAGIHNGDKIIYLDGKNAIRMPLATANDKTTKTDTLPVNIVIKRGNIPSLFEFNVVPKDLQVNSIMSNFLIPETDIGYVKTNRFASSADKEFRGVIKNLRKQGAKKILLDFRAHTGGNVDQAADYADEFIPEGKTLTYIQGKNNDFYQKFVSEKGGICEDLPLVVMIDNQTISAAEIFAGAIQDLDRGIIVGTQSFGKGMAQKVWEFKDGSAFRLTIGDYYTPSGRNVQKIPGKAELDPAIKLQIGEKRANDVQRIIENFGGKAHLPIFKTQGGRVVLGGGGIYPDYFVKQDTTTLLTQVMISKGIIVDFAYNFIANDREKLLNKYKKDYFAFAKDFKIDDTMLKQLENLSRSKNIWNDEMYKVDKEYIRNYIKSVIAFNIWGNEGFYANDYKKDNVIQEALKLFPEAEKIFKGN